MVSSVSNHVGYASLSGLADRFRQRNAGSIVNAGNVRAMDGFNIDVTGTNTRSQKTTTTAFQPGSGGRTHKPEATSNMLGITALSSTLKTQEISLNRVDIEKAMSRVPDEAYMVSVPETVDIVHTEEVPVEQINGIGYFDRVPQSRGEEIAQIEQQIDRLGRLADIERELSQEHGAPVKLAWDPVSEEYLMLKPGQAGYDRVRGAQDQLSTVKSDLGKMDHVARDFREVLERYGVKV